MLPHIRSAFPADAHAISTVRARSWRAGYRGMMPDDVLDGMDIEGWAARAEVWLQEREGRGRDWVAEAQGEVVGWASRFLPARDEDLGPTVAELVAIYVLPSHWGNGLGHALFEVVVADLLTQGTTEISLWVVEANDRARRFYERQGFAADGRREDSKVSRAVEVFSVRYRRRL